MKKKAQTVPPFTGKTEVAQELLPGQRFYRRRVTNVTLTRRKESSEWTPYGRNWDAIYLLQCGHLWEEKEQTGAVPLTIDCRRCPKPTAEDKQRARADSYQARAQKRRMEEGIYLRRRELEVLIQKKRDPKTSFRAIGEKMGISTNRVRELYLKATKVVAESGIKFE